MKTLIGPHSMHGLFLLYIDCKRRAVALLVLAFVIFLHIPLAAAVDHELTDHHIKPGFNCAKGHSKNEQLICNDPELSRTDYELSLLYAQAKLAARNSSAFRKKNNEEWLWREKNCHDRNCLLQWYANRHNQLVTALGKHVNASSSSPITTNDNVSSTSVVVENTAANSPRQHNTADPAALSQQMISLPLIQRPIVWVIIIVTILFISLAWDALNTDKSEKKRARMIAAAVNSNISEFLEQHGRSHTNDIHDAKKWDREKRRFIDDMVKPSLTDCTPLSITDADRLSLIIDYVAWGVKHDNHQYRFRGDLNDSEQGRYLQFCARVLKHQGWKLKSVRITKPDGYLLATRKSYQIPMVCRSQSLPVGMEVLREARELQAKHKARKVVVISNAPFTTAVEHEAQSCGALLVNHLALSMLAAMVKL